MDKKTTITLYDHFFEAGDPGLFGIGGNQDEVRGLILAHEIGHVLGLSDVYRIEGDPEDWPAVEDALMGNAWLADEEDPSLDSAGIPDVNGLNILQRTPWYQVGSTMFFWESPGAFTSGWLSFGGNRYYFRPSASSPSLGLPFSMVVGLQSIDGSWCLFAPTGELFTGWYTDGYGRKYYFESDGSRSYGWRSIGGATYYFGGADDGAMRTGWQTIEGQSYYFGTDGKLQGSPGTGNEMDSHIPASTTETTGNYIKGAATRDAMPALEMLGLASVEESGQFVDTANYYNWVQPKYMLAATTYNSVLSPFLANLGTNSGTTTYPAAVYNESRAGGGQGPNGSLEAVGGSDTSDQAVWARQPDVVVGTGGGVGYPAYAAGVSYGFSNYFGLATTMKNIAAAADAADAAATARTLRYGEQSATAIAQDYEEFVFGTMGAVQQAINDGTVAKKTVALVENATYNSRTNTWVYDLMTTAESGGDGTASTNRYLETTVNSGIVGISLATNYADTHPTATAADLASVDLVMVGGQQSSANYSAIMNGLTADGLLGKTYFVNNNGSAGAMYGVVMNSVENAQNVGRILGCLYPGVVSQQSWMAYYYETFYHINPGDLRTVMNNALDDVRNWTVTYPATAAQAYQWDLSTAYASGVSKTTVEWRIANGYAYYESL